MDSRYQHQLYEQQISKLWLSHAAFIPSPTPPKNAPPFTIVLPPPNANDPLHVGHAMYTIEDVLIRFHRMLGHDTLWLPGVDHAGIETQFVFEKKLQKQGQSRFQFDRDTLYRMIWDYVQENADIAKQQLQKLGFALDWSRFKYMLDPDVVTTVLNTFQKLHQQKLVYRELKLVNYCPKCGTAFSDLEVKHRPTKTPLYYLKYGPFTLATTRPETKFGDTAVAVHPADQRYQKYLGQKITVTGLLGTFKLQVIADEYVDPNFGTGVVKITPYHDHNDFQVWQRHKKQLPEPIQVIGFDGKLTSAAGKYAGLKVAAARQQIVADLQTQGLLEKIDADYQTQLSTCYRCASTLEPLPLAQFFVKVAPLTRPIIKKLDQGKITIYGPGYQKILRNWLTNLRDWNISRQIVWGIRLPVFYDPKLNPDIQVKFLTHCLPNQAHPDLNCKILDADARDAKGRVLTLISGRLSDALKHHSLKAIKAGLQSLDAPKEAVYQVGLSPTQAKNYLQETDTFDTWFSSSQWPFSTLKNTRRGDFKRFYPLTVMETGYDILPFWVMRMLMMGQFATKKLPFTKIYLHGLVRDSKGQKMSKSKGNVINPLTVVEKYGADALRFALIVRSSPGLDRSIGDPDFKAARNLTNKLWNAARFVSEFSQTRDNYAGISNRTHDLLLETATTKITKQVTKLLGEYKIGVAADLLYDFFWHTFCDQAIEWCKQGELSPTVLTAALKTCLKLWHPFLPFVTEQIWQELGRIRGNEKLLALAAWPHQSPSS